MREIISKKFRKNCESEQMFEKQIMNRILIFSLMKKKFFFDDGVDVIICNNIFVQA